MAVYNLSDNNPKNTNDKNKKIGTTLIVISSIVFLSLLTSFLNFIKSVVLGFFGLFAYPLFLTLLVIGVAFVNNKKYVMTKKYIVYFCLSTLFLMCLLHLMFVEKDLSFLSYISNCYTSKTTVLGLLGGIITAPALVLLNEAAAYVIFSILFVIFGALLADYIYYLNKNEVLKKPIKVKSGLKNDAFINSILTLETKNKQQKVLPKQEVEEIKEHTQNIVMQNKIDEEKDAVKRKLGLIKSSEDVLPQNREVAKEKKEKINFADKQSLKEYLLTPDKTISMEKFHKNNAKKPSIETINESVESIKQSTAPQIVVHDDSQNFSFKPTAVENNTPYLQPEEFVELENEEPKVEYKTAAEESAEIYAKNILEDIIAETKKETKIETNVAPIKTESRRSTFAAISTQPQKPVQKERKKTPYIKPPLNLLTTKSMDLSYLNEDVAQKRILLEDALLQFGIPAKVIEVVVGPAVTRYELEMPAGISVKKILAHSDDIALSLAANGDIRIEAPIPGKSAVGIEVPNSQIATISLHDMIEDNSFQKNTAPLSFVLGKDINGYPRLCDLAKMPHLLIAGSTGSGKSVCLNAVILSLLYKTSPDDVRLILIDPKQVEFAIYNNLPHLLMPNIITDADKALNALGWAVNEMERRYTIFRNTKTRDIGEYSTSSYVKERNMEKMPYIVIIIDELADLLMQSKKDAEEKIARLAQKARSAGIHLILATQRPSVDIITGTIKNNFTSRISFKLMSAADSKTILNQGGAEKLLGKGDMLYKPSDSGEPRRIQGCFVTSKEVDDICEFVRQNNSEFDYDSQIENAIMNGPRNAGLAQMGADSDNNGFDPLMPQALKCVIENGQASISMLQRRLVIGYPRAARIIDQMESSNFVSKSEGSKPRQVLITEEQYEEMFGDI